MEEESLTQRQENEMEVLKSVYSDDFRQIHRGGNAWKVKSAPEGILQLKPLESQAGQIVHVQLDFHFVCQPSYPNEVPELKLENVRGLSSSDCLQLRSKLKKEANRLLGEVMILNLAQMVQEFLKEHNHPFAKSFYDEMMQNQEKTAKEIMEQRSKAQADKFLENERKKMEIEGKLMKALEIDQEESQKLRKERKERSLTRSCSSGSSTPKSGEGKSNQAQQEENESDIVSEFKHFSSCTLIKFNTKKDREVLKGPLIGKSEQGCSIYQALDVANNQLFNIVEWNLCWSTTVDKKDRSAMSKEAEIYKKMMMDVEQELLSLLRLRHKNLLCYVAIKTIVDRGKITLQVLREDAGGQSLSSVIESHQPMSQSVLREIARQLLEALKYLHDSSVAHKDLRASTVYLDKEESIRVAEYSLGKRIFDWYCDMERKRPGVHFEVVQPPTSGRGGKKVDVHRLGILLLSLVQGEYIKEIIPEIPESLPEDAKDFLSMCLLRDEQLRWSVDQLLTHRFLNVIDCQDSKPSLDDDSEDRLQLPLVDPYLSRLSKEFQLLEKLGEGAFGGVIKARNKLDGRMYAIKRIPLNTRSNRFTKKIGREVQLLSRLNHVSIVRYYNSWIEMSVEAADDATQSSISSKALSPAGKYNSLGLSDNIEEQVPKMTSMQSDWSYLSVYSKQSEEDEEEEEGCVFDDIFPKLGDATGYSSDNIVFENNDKKEANGEEFECVQDEEEESHKQILYIQMEFCEKSTLRSCIDARLYEDTKRVMRLFRELVEGLEHIHQQRIIHRDLKPVNIFLDSNDHVKIGDFGLATTDILSRQLTDLHFNSSAVHEMSVGSSGESSHLTGCVGSAFYVAPEILKANKDQSYHYNQKVDLYSLGVMFFEMCNPPPATGSERSFLLSQLRRPEIILPSDFGAKEKKVQKKLLLWMLDHDPTKRPTACELLQSELLPLEETEFQDFRNPDSRSFKKMVATIFDQPKRQEIDFMYNYYAYKAKAFPIQPISLVRQRLSNIFQRHGAAEFSTPLLTPNLPNYMHELCVMHMDESGAIVMLPFELRLPFALHVARSQMTQIKRFCIDRVYRKQKTEMHPRQLMDCAFDIIAPHSQGLCHDGEVIRIVEDVAAEFPCLQQSSFYIRISHGCLLRGLLLCFDIDPSSQAKVVEALRQTQGNRALRVMLTELGLREPIIVSLLKLLNTEERIDKLRQHLKPFCKHKGQAGSLVKRSLNEIEVVINHSHHLGCKLKMFVVPGLLSNFFPYTGTFFSIICTSTRKKQQITETLAFGGRYDELVAEMNAVGHTSPAVSAVGVSFNFEMIVAAAVQEECSTHSVDVLVCSLGQSEGVKHKLEILRDLWNAGISAELCPENSADLTELQEQCKRRNILHLVILKESETGSVRVQGFEKDRMIEKRISGVDLADYLLQKISTSSSEISESIVSAAKSTATSTSTVDTPTLSTNSNFSISLVLDGAKPTNNSKRRYEGQVYTGVNCLLQKFSSRVRSEILAVELKEDVLAFLAAHLVVTKAESHFQTSSGLIVEKYPRYRKYLQKIFNEIHSILYNETTRSIVLIIYGLKDDIYKVLL